MPRYCNQINILKNIAKPFPNPLNIVLYQHQYKEVVKTNNNSLNIVCYNMLLYFYLILVLLGQQISKTSECVTFITDNIIHIYNISKIIILIGFWTISYQISNYEELSLIFSFTEQLWKKSNSVKSCALYMVILIYRGWIIKYSQPFFK